MNAWTMLLRVGMRCQFFRCFAVCMTSQRRNGESTLFASVVAIWMGKLARRDDQPRLWHFVSIGVQPTILTAKLAANPKSRGWTILFGHNSILSQFWTVLNRFYHKSIYIPILNNAIQVFRCIDRLNNCNFCFPLYTPKQCVWSN